MRLLAFVVLAAASPLMFASAAVAQDGNLGDSCDDLAGTCHYGPYGCGAGDPVNNPFSFFGFDIGTSGRVYVVTSISNDDTDEYPNDDYECEANGVYYNLPLSPA